MLKLSCLFVCFTTAAFAQTPNAQDQHLKSYDMLVQQRNQAMDGVAYCVGEMQSQVEALKRQLEEAKKACEKPKE